MSDNMIPMDTDTLNSMIKNAVIVEREACAKVAENSNFWPLEGADIAKEIRER